MYRIWKKWFLSFRIIIIIFSTASLNLFEIRLSKWKNFKNPKNDNKSQFYLWVWSEALSWDFVLVHKKEYFIYDSRNLSLFWFWFVKRRNDRKPLQFCKNFCLRLRKSEKGLPAILDVWVENLHDNYYDLLRSQGKNLKKNYKLPEIWSFNGTYWVDKS